MKRRIVVKRIYEKGKEVTLSPAVKKNSTKAKVAESRNAARRVVSPTIAKSREVSAKKEKVLIPPSAGRPSLKRIFIDDYEFPQNYGTSRLRLLVKDPLSIYAYWQLPQDLVRLLSGRLSKEEIDSSRLVLRMYDVTLINFDGTNANSYFDTEVGFSTTNWYIKLWLDNISYIAELGLLIKDGKFFALVRSNQAHTPRAGYSPRSEQIWMQVKEDEGKSIFVRPIINRSAPNYDKPKTGPKRRIYLSEEDISNYYANLSPLLRDIISLRLLSARKRVGFKFILEGESEQSRRDILSKLPKGYFIKRIMLGASENLVILGGGSEERFGGASEFNIKQHQFLFEIATELVVYGRTEPNAEVWLGDKNIELRRDGTFTLRFALPDGKIPLEFKAVSHDKINSKKINAKVERRTDPQV